MNSPRIANVPAILTRFSLSKDGGVSLGFSTQELTSEEKLVLGSFHQKFGHLLFREDTVQPEDVPQEDSEFSGKTPSKRLRASLYVWWDKLGKKGDFEDFYRAKMEQIIEQIKNKLD